MNGQDPRDNIPYVTPARFNAMLKSPYDADMEFGGTAPPSRSTKEKAYFADKSRKAYKGPHIDLFVMNQFDMPDNDIETFAQQAAEEKALEQRANLERLADAIIEEHYLAQPRKTLEAGSQEPSYQDIVMENASMDEKYSKSHEDNNLQACTARDLEYKMIINSADSQKDLRRYNFHIDNSKRKKLADKTGLVRKIEGI
jgi:hypothetical protein